MIERLANVVYWLGCVLGVGWLALMVFLAGTSPNMPNAEEMGWVTGLGGAAIIWLIGLTIRYVLIGHRS